MAILKRSEIQEPVLPRETVEVPELGGEVVVQGLLLSDRFEVFDPGKSKRRESRILAATIRDADDQPLFSAEQWERFAASNFTAAMRLLDVASRLSGFGIDRTEENPGGN